MRGLDRKVEEPPVRAVPPVRDAKSVALLLEDDVAAHRVVDRTAELRLSRGMRRVKLVPVGILQSPRFNSRSLTSRGPGHQDQVVVGFVLGQASVVASKRLNGWRMGRLELRPVAAVPCPCVVEAGL